MVVRRVEKVKRSHYLTILFLCLISLSAWISEVFQQNHNSLTSQSLIDSPISADILENAMEISLKNKLGEYLLDRKDKNAFGERTWNIKKPRVLRADMDTVEKIFQTLSGIKIRQVFHKDTINQSNFYLDNPRLQINITSQTGDIVKIKFGLVNPTDNSTYLSISNEDIIYQIEPLGFKLDSYSLNNFIESKIFSIDPKEIQYIKIAKNQGYTRTLTHMIKQKRDWKDSKGRELENEKIILFLNRLTSIRSQIILDQKSKNIASKIEKVAEKPLYEIELKDNDNRVYHYKFSGTINNLDELKLPRRKHIVAMASNRTHPFLISTDFLKTINTNTSQFKRLSIKKLFY